MNKVVNNNVLNYYLSEYYNYDDTNQELYKSVSSLIGEYSSGETELLSKLSELRKALYSTVEIKKFGNISKTLSSEQISMLNSLESREENDEYYLDIKKLIDEKLAYMKENIGRDLDELKAIDNIVNEITYLYASNIESLSEMIRRRKEFNEALSNYRERLKFTIMAFVKALNVTTTTMDSDANKDRKEYLTKRKNKLLERIASLFEEARFHNSFVSQSESYIEILEQAYETNIERLYKVKMSYDYLIYEAFDLYNANAALKANASIDSISENLPDYNTQNFVTNLNVKKTDKNDIKILSDDSLKKSIERTVEILNSSYMSLGDMRKTSAILTPMLATENALQSEQKGVIKLIMHNGDALNPISKK